jgi:hypothetical protein
MAPRIWQYVYTAVLSTSYVNWKEIVTVLFNSGTYPKTGAQIPEKETVNLILSNSIKKFPNFSHQPIPATKPDLSNPIIELYPVDKDPPQSINNVTKSFLSNAC